MDGLTARLQTIKPKSADYEVQQRKIRDSRCVCVGWHYGSCVSVSQLSKTR